MPVPTIHSSRIVLRSFRLEDGPVVMRLAGDRLVADTTATVPHPYEEGMAEQWIGTHSEAFESGKAATFAIEHATEHSLLGTISIHMNIPFRWAEMGYWIGRPYWNMGYCTDAAREVIRYAFETLGLNRVHATHFTRNPASGRVMQKAGMTLEGVLRQWVLRWDRFEDLAMYSILRTEWQRLSTRAVSENTPT